MKGGNEICAQCDLAKSEHTPYFKTEKHKPLGIEPQGWLCPTSLSSSAIRVFKSKSPPEFLEAQSLPEKPKLAVGVSVLVVSNESLLLRKRINNTASGLYSTPGGRLELNEDMYQCAIRETLEETGLTLDHAGLSVVGFKEHFRFGLHYIMFYMKATSFSGTLQNVEPNKCEGWEWFPLNNLPKDCTEPLDILAELNIPEELTAEERVLQVKIKSLQQFIDLQRLCIDAADAMYRACARLQLDYYSEYVHPSRQPETKNFLEAFKAVTDHIENGETLERINWRELYEKHKPSKILEEAAQEMLLQAKNIDTFLGPWKGPVPQAKVSAFNYAAHLIRQLAIKKAGEA